MSTPLLAEHASSSAPSIREYTPADREAVRDICCRAAFREMGAQALLGDSELFADYWTRYYTDFEPDSMLVAEDDGRVIGCLFGCVDTARFRRTMTWSIMPGILARFAWRWTRGQYRHVPHRFALLRWLLLRSWREAPRVDVARFPAHYHVNLLPEGYDRCLYSSLALRFLDLLDARGVTRLNGQVTERAERSAWYDMIRRFARKRPGWVQHYDERESTMARALWGSTDPVVNRAFGFAVGDLRDWLSWVARRYRL